MSAPDLAQQYAYDANGNRTARTSNGVDTLYGIDPASNRLAAVGSVAYTHDASGNLVGPANYGYDSRNRLSRFATAGGIVYDYGIDALGQRASKISSALSGGGRIYTYDRAGHLLGEYTAAGARIAEHIWLGERPVAVVGAGGAVFYVLSDHLDTPRQILDDRQRLRWTWDNRDPFGNNPADPNPQGLGGFGYNLRFPGQFFDAESGLHYNYFRDYDPRLGRYVESDPIGLNGGLNTYLYANANPNNFFDSQGLNAGVGLGTGVILFCTRYPSACAAGTVALCRLLGGRDTPVGMMNEDASDSVGEGCPANLPNR